MPKKATNRYTPQFRAKAVQLAMESGRPTMEVARNPGVPNQTLYAGSPRPTLASCRRGHQASWRRQSRKHAGSGASSLTSPQQHCFSTPLTNRPLAVRHLHRDILLTQNLLAAMCANYFVTSNRRITLGPLECV